MVDVVKEINKELTSLSNAVKLLNDLQNKNIFNASYIYRIKLNENDLLNCMQKLEYLNYGSSSNDVIKTINTIVPSIQNATALLREIQNMESSLSASSLYRIKLNTSDLARFGRKLQSIKNTLENEDVKN